MERFDFADNYIDAKIKHMTGLSNIEPSIQLIADMKPKEITYSELDLVDRLKDCKQTYNLFSSNYENLKDLGIDAGAEYLKKIYEIQTDIELLKTYRSAIIETKDKRKTLTKRSGRIMRYLGVVAFTAFFATDLTYLNQAQHTDQSIERTFENNILSSPLNLSIIGLVGTTGGITSGTFLHSISYRRLARIKARKIIRDSNNNTE